MGVEPTHERAGARATILKTARPTGTRTPPCRDNLQPLYLAAGSASRVYCLMSCAVPSRKRMRCVGGGAVPGRCPACFMYRARVFSHELDVCESLPYTLECYE